MIIIKSQDGAIGKYDFVTPQTNNGVFGYVSGGTEMILLGSYETEERAKEVMEEIEKHFKV